MNNWVFINKDLLRDEEACLHYRDLALQRGYGIFDFLKVVNGQPVYLDDHLNRFYFSSGQMRLPVESTPSELRGFVRRLIRKNNMDDGGIRLTLTGGYSPDGYTPAKPNLIISSHSFQSPSPQDFERGIKLMTYPYQRQLPEIKTIDYLMAVWLQPIIKENDADEVLYCNEGLVRECPRSNFFMVTADNRLVTPATQILKGITRKKILEIASGRMEIEERKINIDEIASASEVFICSTTKLILPVRQVDQIIMPANRPVTQTLYNLLIQYQAASSIPVSR